MAAALRLGWAPGDFPPLLPTQADGRRAHMHPARGKCWHHHDVPAECQCSGLWPATGMRVTPQGCGQAAPCRCADGPVQAGLNSGSLGGHWDAAACARAVYKHEARLGVEHSMARIRSRKGVADLHTAQHIYARLVFIRFRFRFRVRFNGFR